ncbi:hypothetical protein [Methanocalculus alkaliphilus]|uniref:hypothetical protein n=1 Tax=Methanocalculus alkaliphilus TaxID=768730 RepID=UPI00209D877A|nr:hypothetical protein [Methanocalculus alkaliphilus]
MNLTREEIMDFQRRTYEKITNGNLLADGHIPEGGRIDPQPSGNSIPVHAY